MCTLSTRDTSQQIGLEKLCRMWPSNPPNDQFLAVSWPTNFFIKSQVEAKLGILRCLVAKLNYVEAKLSHIEAELKSRWGSWGGLRPFKLDVGSKLRGQGAVWPHEGALEAKNGHRMPSQGVRPPRSDPCHGLKTALTRRSWAWEGGVGGRVNSPITN